MRRGFIVPMLLIATAATAAAAPATSETERVADAARVIRELRSAPETNSSVQAAKPCGFAATIVGSLFVPFLAGTLYLNNFLIPADWGVPPNTVLTNVVLICALIPMGSLVRPKLDSCHDSANFPRAGGPCAGSYPGWRTATEIECPSRVPGRPSREGRGGLS